MNPTNTFYRLARAGGEWNRIRAIAARAGHLLRKGDFGWPTVVAERDGRVVGFLSTIQREDAVWAGPLVVEAEPKHLIWLRLAEAYENLLREAGVKTYFISIPEAMTDYIDQVERCGFSRVGVDQAEVVFERHIS